MITKRRHFSGDQKVAVLKRYLVEKVALSDLCDEYGIQPNQVYQWQATLFENAATVFQQASARAKAEAAAGEEKVARLEAKLQQKNEVIAELMEENVRAKKANGEL
jgi:transposase